MNNIYLVSMYLACEVHRTNRMNNNSTNTKSYDNQMVLFFLHFDLFVYTWSNTNREVNKSLFMLHQIKWIKCSLENSVWRVLFRIHWIRLGRHEIRICCFEPVCRWNVSVSVLGIDIDTTGMFETLLLLSMTEITPVELFCVQCQWLSDPIRIDVSQYIGCCVR